MKLPYDKVLHLLAGYSIAATLLPFSFVAAGLGVVGAAGGREMYNNATGSKADVVDFAVTLLGGLTYGVWIYLVG